MKAFPTIPLYVFAMSIMSVILHWLTGVLNPPLPLLIGLGFYVPMIFMGVGMVMRVKFD